MVYLVIALALVAGVVLGYRRYVDAQMRKPRGATVYNSFVARFIKPNGVMSLWRTIYLHDIRQKLDDVQMAHELHHIDAQWARWPYTFLFRILWDYARNGYDGSHYENEARRAAGQPERTRTHP